ncbi:MAG: cation diffusion facilitator family transporter [Thermoplasmatota archaeon]
MRSLEYRLPELDCDDCAAELHKRLMADPGVRNVTVDLQGKQVKVEVDEEAFAARTLEQRVGSLLNGEAQAVVHHNRRTRAVEGTPAEGTQGRSGSPAVEALGSDGVRPPPPLQEHVTLPALAVLGREATEASGPSKPANDGHAGHDHAGHSHGEDGHDHDHRTEFREQAAKRASKLLIVVVLGALVIIGELVAAYYSGSLALLADAAHATTDLAAVALALLAAKWVVKQATQSKTWGYHRGEIIAAFVNALLLWGVSAYFIYEAFQRLRNPPEIEGPLVIVAGLLTLIANLAFARILHTPHGGNINMRAAYLHVLSDALGSLAALLSGVAIWKYGWLIADPLLTIFITLLIVVFTWRLTGQTFHILMEGAPKHAQPEDVANAMRAIPGVQDVHDLHVWTLTSGIDSISAHVVTHQPEASDRVVHAVQDILKAKFKIDHVTVQVEDPSCPCTGARHQWHAA